MLEIGLMDWSSMHQGVFQLCDPEMRILVEIQLIVCQLLGGMVELSHDELLGSSCAMMQVLIVVVGKMVRCEVCHI